jgi:acetoin utilization protein AcuB
MEPQLVRDIMQTELITATVNESLADVGRRLLDSGQRRVPVINDAREILGILSERDLRLAADSPLLDESPDEILQNLENHHVQEIMTTAVHTIEGDAPIVEAAQLMRVARVSGLPVVEYDESGNHERLVGLITADHLLDHLIRLLEQQAPADEILEEGAEEGE